jgi:5'(3')-deoxyribonucleotidase
MRGECHVHCCSGFDVYKHEVALHKQQVLADKRPLICEMFPHGPHHTMVSYFQ